MRQSPEPRTFRTSDRPPLQQVVGVDLVDEWLLDRILGESLVVDEEKYQKDGVRRREGDARDHVDRLRDAYWMRRFLFAHLHEARLFRAE